jgi:phosphatidylglycerophosphatase A
MEKRGPEMIAFIERWFRRASGSVFFLGYIPGAPGTVGSLIVVALLWFYRSQAAPYFCPAYYTAYWMAALLLVAFSIVVGNYASEDFGSSDPKPFILDEVAGQFITFFMIPFSLSTLVLGFFLFRFFDIIKPFPIYKLEEIDGGTGITLDDVAAGVLANISLIGLLALYHALRAVL